MSDGSVYYCWSCDAHRKALLGADQAPSCPSCSQVLTEDSRLATQAPSLQIPSFIIDIPHTARAPKWARPIATAS